MTTREILDRFRGLSALVVGDICLDRWCRYDPAAADLSRETGIPRIGVVSARTTAGAGGTVANNLIDLGAGRVAVLGVIGHDGYGYELKRELALRQIDPSLLVEVHGMQTFTYTKLINNDTGVEDLPRVDFITTHELSEEVYDMLIERFWLALPEFDAVLVSDQAETEHGGTVSAPLRDALSQATMECPDKVFWVDSRMRLELFRGVVAKPNLLEAELACQRLFGRMDLERLRRHIGDRPLVVTCGAEGARIVDDGGIHTVPGASVASPIDICGAGDGFSAAAALTLAATSSIFEAVRIGNLAASVTIMKPGTGTATPAEVLEAESRQ
ncbi:MAG: ribokinase [Acidimicrobiia bacterium]|nr:ribokinase [Acidimicrobiia bacterium]